MATTINGVICQEIVRDFGEDFDLMGGPRAMKGFYCDWADRYRVVIGLLGLSNPVSVGGVITINAPLQYPEISTIYCHSVRVEPKGSPIQGATQIAWPNCIIWAEYRTMPWSWAGIDYMQIDPSHPLLYAKQNLSMSIQFYEIPSRALYYATGKVPTGQNKAFPCPIINMEITLVRMPYLPAQGVLSAATNGPLNSGTFLGCADGTVMFNGMTNDQSWDAAGNFNQDVTFSFAYRPIAPWDYGYNASIPGWDKVVDGSSNPIMKRTDLSVLFPGYYGA